MPALWECESCGFTEKISILAKTVLKIVYTNDIWKVYRIFCLEEDTTDGEYSGEDDYRTWEDILFTCPKCGNKESSHNVEQLQSRYPFGWGTSWSFFNSYLPRKAKRDGV